MKYDLFVLIVPGKSIKNLGKEYKDVKKVLKEGTINEADTRSIKN